ncbi:hypothetical protein QUF07_03850 [Lentilactobacillus sp. TOM.63]|uniref:hypothetical protein n=1 Tax=Lentilactobacillus sp. TOM.63 TaxID=3055077 RepID=UPI0025A0EF0C|nr:hypothetical protein [Lentilactobacillus sp. TOM.63]MDM7515842.1 hypothetical protein [Lentilactobacillus sp. TOM.63]
MNKAFKLITATVATAAVSFGLALAGSTTAATAHAANTFASSEISGPSGYFYNSKVGVAFHWKNIKTSNGVQTMMIIGDFKTPKFTTGIPVGNKISKNKRTFTANYRQITSKSKLTKTTYSFNLYKLSTNKYQVKISKSGNGHCQAIKGRSIPSTEQRRALPIHLPTSFLNQHWKKNSSSNMIKTSNKLTKKQKLKVKTLRTLQQILQFKSRNKKPFKPILISISSNW